MFENIKTRNIIRLIYILLVFTLLTSVTFSRHMASLSGEDTVTMATFAITSDIIDAEGTITEAIPFQLVQTDSQISSVTGGEEGVTSASAVTEEETEDDGIVHYQLVITNVENGSVTNVTMDYELTFEVTNNLPITVVLQEVDESEQDDGYGTIAPSTDSEDETIKNAYTITDASLVHTEEIEHVYDIFIAWDEEGSKDYTLSYEIDLITVKINAVQNVDVPSTES